MRGGWTGGASDIEKAESSAEDPRATRGLVLIFLTLGSIKQSNTHLKNGLKQGHKKTQKGCKCVQINKNLAYSQSKPPKN